MTIERCHICGKEHEMMITPAGLNLYKDNIYFCPYDVNGKSIFVMGGIMNINEKLIWLEELIEDIDMRLIRMEAGYQEQIDSINTQGEMISDLNAELSELQVKFLTKGEDV